MPRPRQSLHRFGFALALCLLLVAAAAAQDGDRRTIERYQQALQADPDNPVLQYALGVELLQNGDNSAAINVMRKAYPAYTDSIEMNYNMGLAFTRIGDPDSALLYLEQAEALSTRQGSASFSLINAYYNVALLYQDKEALEDATALLEKVFRLDPQRLEIYRILGDIAARKGDDTRAIALYTTYRQHYPDDPTARENLYGLHVNRATKARESGDFASAQQEYVAALAMVPESPTVYYFLGELAYTRGDRPEATRYLARVFPELREDMKQNARAMLYNSANDALTLQMTEDALAAIAPLLGDGNPRIKDLLLAGNIRLSRNEFIEARDIYAQVLAREPGNPQASINIATAEDRAIDSLFTEGLSRFKADEFQQALPFFEQILAIHPKDKRADTFRRKCREKMRDDAEKAFAEADKALKRNDLLKAMARVQHGLALAPGNRDGVQLEQEIRARLTSIIESMLSSGEELLGQEDFAAAENQFNKVLELEPENPHATAGLTRARALRQQQASAAVIAGNQALDEGRLPAARKSFDRAITLAPTLEEATEARARLDALQSTMLTQEIQWGRAARAAGQLEQARRHFTKALELQDSADIRRELAAIDSARASELAQLLKLAQAARARKDFKKALRYYDQAEAVDSLQAAAGRRDMDAEIGLYIEQQLTSASSLVHQGKPREALALYRKVLELSPDNPVALKGLKDGRAQLAALIDTSLAQGQKALDAGKLQQARTAYEQILEVDPYHAVAKTQLQHIDSLQQRDINTGDEKRLYFQGIDLYTRGRYTEAVEIWEQVLLIAPENKKARENIDRAKRKLQSIREFQGG